MKRLLVTYMLVLVSYFIGERIFAAAFPMGMDHGMGFWAILRETFDLQNYSLSYIELVTGISLAITLFATLTPRRISLAALSILSALSGGYYFGMFYAGEDSGLEQLDNWTTAHFGESNSPFLAAAFLGLFLFC